MQYTFQQMLIRDIIFREFEIPTVTYSALYTFVLIY